MEWSDVKLGDVILYEWKGSNKEDCLKFIAHIVYEDELKVKEVKCVGDLNDNDLEIFGLNGVISRDKEDNDFDRYTLVEILFTYDSLDKVLKDKYPEYYI